MSARSGGAERSPLIHFKSNSTVRSKMSSVLTLIAAIADADDRDIIGNGRAISLLFGREGAHAACIDINRESAETTATRVKDEGGKAFVEVADVGDADAIAPLVDRCRTQLGGLDGLVLNVGISKGLRLDGMTAEIWDRDFAVNVRSNRLFAQKALEVIEPGATIVILSSLASFRAVGRNPAYETSKAAQVALSRSIARAGEPKGIRCNSIAPGYVDTPMGRDASRRRPDRAVQVPFGRQATGWEGRIRSAIPDVARVLICQRALPRSGRWAPLRHRQRVSRRG